MGSSRTNPFKNESDLQGKPVLDNIKICGIRLRSSLVAGGRDTLGVAKQALQQAWCFPHGPVFPRQWTTTLTKADFTFGFDTAPAGVGMEALDPCARHGAVAPTGDGAGSDGTPRGVGSQRMSGLAGGAKTGSHAKATTRCYGSALERGTLVAKYARSCLGGWNYKSHRRGESGRCIPDHVQLGDRNVGEDI